MNTVDFFGKKVSKLIIGDNPMTGHSYIEDKITGADMYKYYTTEKIKEALWRMEELGYNAMLPLATPFMIKIFEDYQNEGGKMQFIWQPYMPMDQKTSMRQMKNLNTIGIYHQGTTTDNLYETGRCEEIRERIKLYRDLGVPVGLGTHRPDVIELSEEEGWDVDFYVACMQNARRGREGEPSGFLSGKTKAGIVFYPEDRPVMLETLKKVSKPIIAYKIFAGGQMLLNKPQEEKEKLIKGAYEEVFTALKPNDFAAIGVFQRDEDQLEEDARLYNEWYNGR
ncbi:MAG: hypothetical protein IJY93_07860 [Clostridia bacterium]|nr:hypothetical protein [Clostridia bacterium]